MKESFCIWYHGAHSGDFVKKWFALVLCFRMKAFKNAFQFIVTDVIKINIEALRVHNT